MPAAAALELTVLLCMCTRRKKLIALVSAFAGGPAVRLHLRPHPGSGRRQEDPAARRADALRHAAAGHVPRQLLRCLPDALLAHRPSGSENSFVRRNVQQHFRLCSCGRAAAPGTCGTESHNAPAGAPADGARGACIVDGEGSGNGYLWVPVTPPGVCAICAVFRSAIDSWAISQVFPVMPIHRLEQVGPSSTCSPHSLSSLGTSMRSSDTRNPGLLVDRVHLIPGTCVGSPLTHAILGACACRAALATGQSRVECRLVVGLLTLTLAHPPGVACGGNACGHCENFKP